MKMNQNKHIINVLLTAFAWSVRESLTGKQNKASERKPHANTFPYRPRTQLTSLI